MSTNEIAVPEAPETHIKAQTALAEAETLLILSDSVFRYAGEFRESLKEIQSEIDRTFDDTIAAAFKAHKTAVAAKKRYSEPLEQALKIIKQKMIAYQNEQEQKRRLDQARLEAEAKKKAEDQALELAQMLIDAGATEAAEQVLEEPIQVAPVILPSTPKVQGFSKRRIYSAEVFDRDRFMFGVYEGTIPNEAWQPDMQFLNKQAGALKEALAWPGVKVVWREV